MNAGRPRKIDDAMKERVLGYVLANGSMTGAAEIVGVDRRTLYREMERDEDFATEIHKARGGFRQELVQKVRNAEDWKAAAWLLERQYGDEFGNLQKHEVSGKDGGPLVVFRPHSAAEWSKDAGGSGDE